MKIGFSQILHFDKEVFNGFTIANSCCFSVKRENHSTFGKESSVLHKVREEWKTRVGFLLAAIGCAVGLGNIWRFPYVVYKSGGGAFFIPYLVAIFFVGLPLMILEFGLGHKEQGAAPTAFYRVNKSFEFPAWWAVLFTSFGVLCYYNVILSWCINYLVYAFDFSWGNDPATFFSKQFLQESGNPFSINGFRWPIVVGLAFVWALVWFTLIRGVSKGIEIATKAFIPVLIIIVTFLVLWSLTLPGAGEGIKTYLTPDFSKIWDNEIWRNAFGQVFFSLSLGYGMMIAYASYLPRKTDINVNAGIVTFSNSAFEVFAGFAVFSVLGFMAIKSGKPVSEVVAQGPGLSFIAYPQAINELPFGILGKQIFGILFFMALFIAGITSSFALMECFVTAAQDKFSWNRKKLVHISCIISFLLGLVFTTRAGVYWLDIVDNFINKFGVVCIAFLECVLVARVFGHKKFLEYVNKHSSANVGLLWKFSICVFIPIILIVMLVTGVWESVRAPYGGYSWNAVLSIGVGALVLTLIVALFFTRARWIDIDFKHIAKETE